MEIPIVRLNKTEAVGAKIKPEAEVKMTVAVKVNRRKRGWKKTNREEMVLTTAS